MCYFLFLIFIANISFLMYYFIIYNSRKRIVFKHRVANYSLYDISYYYFKLYETETKKEWENISVCLFLSAYNCTQGCILSVLSNYNLFWPSNIGKKILLLDKGDEYLEPYIAGNWEVQYEKYEIHGYLRKEYSTYIAHKYCLPNKYIAYMDTDSIFTMKVTKYMLFDIFNKPYFLYTNKIRYKQWNPLKILKINKKAWGDAMITFPVVVYTEHMLNLNKYLIDLHNLPLEKIIKSYYTSQFCVILEYVKKYYKNCYHFSIYEVNPIIRCGVHIPYAYNISGIKRIKSINNLYNFVKLINGITYDGICSIFYEAYPDKCRYFNYNTFFKRLYVIDEFSIVVSNESYKDKVYYKSLKRKLLLLLKKNEENKVE